MNTLTLTYEILNRLEHDDGTAAYKGQLISPNALNAETNRWRNVMRDLQKNGYIDGYEERKDILGNTDCNIRDVYITVKGAEYLKENSTFKKLSCILTDVITVTMK